MVRAEVEQGGHPESQSNRLLELAKEVLNQETKELSDSNICGVASIVGSAYLSEDGETLDYISDMAQRMQSPVFIKDSTQRAKIFGIGMVAAEGAWMYRPTPSLTETQLASLQKIADSKFQKSDEIDSETLDFLSSHGLICKILVTDEQEVIDISVTPFGRKAIKSMEG